MRRFFKYLFLVPVALVVLALAVANRHLVTIFLDPFAGPTPEGTQIDAPLYIVILGSFTTWLEQGKYRRAARRAKTEENSLRAEIARLTMPRPGDKRKIL